MLSVLSNGELPLAVKVNDLSITYRTTFERRPTLKQALVRFGRGQRAVREVEAIKNISFEVRTGTALGIIGKASLRVAGEVCIYTNTNLRVESLE